MFWVIVAAAVWIYILMFIRLRGLKKFWSAAIWSVLLAFFLNLFFVRNGFYLFQDIYYPLEAIPLSYLIAAAGEGIILMRYLPDERWWQFFYLIVFAAAVCGIEHLIQGRGYLQYLRWSIYNSYVFRLIAYITLTWLSSLIIKRKQLYFYR